MSDDFGLLETLLWTPGDGFALLPEHLARLSASSAALGFAFDAARVEAALRESVAAAPATHLRVRLILSRDGALEASATPVEPVPAGAVWRVALAQTRFFSGDATLRHKTTRRARYEDELAAAQRVGADEALFLNERDEACESARCNLFLPRGETLLTPPLGVGLLPGTLRAKLLADGRAAEQKLFLSDLADGFLLGNSVRGLVAARLID